MMFMSAMHNYHLYAGAAPAHRGFSALRLSENTGCRACSNQPSLVWDCWQVLLRPRVRNRYRRCRQPALQQRRLQQRRLQQRRLQRRRLQRRRHIRRPKSTPIPVAARTGNISLTRRPAAIKTPHGNHIRPLISLPRRTKTKCRPTAAETTVGGEAYSAQSRHGVTLALAPDLAAAAQPTMRSRPTTRAS